MARKRKTTTSTKKDVVVTKPVQEVKPVDVVAQGYTKTMRLEALSFLSGKYDLPYSPGQRFIIATPQGEELIKNNDAKPV